MMQPPDQVDLEKVVPLPTLGQNFEKKSYPALTVSTKSRVWGDKPSNSLESDPRDLTADIRNDVERKFGTACYYCGFEGRDNEMHNVNDNHRDVTVPNLRPICRICHLWKHMGEVATSQGSLAYLPGLSGQDANHLQRTIAVALADGDDALKQDAKALLAWLVTHQKYVSDAWTTHDQGVFAASLQRANPDQVAKHGPVVFEGLALVLNPKAVDRQVAGWRREGYARYPSAKWGQLYHTYINAPI